MYIYTVKPLKEATEIAIEKRHFEVEENGNIRIYGIFRENWPAGVTVKSAERKTEGKIYNVGRLRLIIPLCYFNETEEKDEKEVPEFIKNLYTAMQANCAGVSCSKCPLMLIDRMPCGNIQAWLKKEWPEL